MSQHFKARVDAVEDFTGAQLRRLVLRPLVPGTLPAYRAGQYAMIAFPGLDPRPFSIGNAPGSDYLEFHIRRTASGGASEFAITMLQEGHILDLEAPFGSCTYEHDMQRPVVAVAGGSGLACMKAIVEAALRDPGRRAPVYLYCGARQASDVYLNDRFHELERKDPLFHFIPVLSEEKQDEFRHGLVGDVMAADFPDLANCRVYGAGPVDMMRHLTGLALARGAPSGHIHTDLQLPPAPPLKNDVIPQ